MVEALVASGEIFLCLVHVRACLSTEHMARPEDDEPDRREEARIQEAFLDFRQKAQSSYKDT